MFRYQNFEDVQLFGERDFTNPGSYYVKVKARLRDRYRLLLIPSHVKTEWLESEAFEVEAPDS